MIHSIQTIKAKHLPSGSWKQLGFVESVTQVEIQGLPCVILEKKLTFSSSSVKWE